MKEEFFSQLQEKEVINVCDGGCLGCIGDFILEIPSGRICTLIVPKESGRFCLFSREQAYFIPWNCIKKIGEDTILIEVEQIERLLRTID